MISSTKWCTFIECIYRFMNTKLTWICIKLVEKNDCYTYTSHSLSVLHKRDEGSSKYARKIKKKKLKFPLKKVLTHENRWKHALCIYSQLRDLTIFFCARPKFFKKS
jgi:hypothetical protein